MPAYFNLKRSAGIKLGLLGLVISLLAFVPRQDDPLDRLVAALQKWTDTTAHEKVYLHIDKPYYAIGDTIWFKAYVTTGPRHQLSAKSGALYVELINPADSVATLLKVPVMAGMSKGNFILPKTFIEGNYRLRAYTQWMRNAGPDYFYDKVIAVKTADHQNIFTNVNYQYTATAGKKYLTAILNYTDSLGNPLRNISVKFNLRKNYNTLYSGDGVTDMRGNLAVALKEFDTKKLKGSSIITRAQLQNYEIVTKSFPIKSLAMQADVQFFPEGGYMVDGYAGRVAFKAIGTDGLGIDVKGVITDDLNHEVASFGSRHLGMGDFTLQPAHNRSYSAAITYADGSVNVVKLPEVQPYGYVMSVDPNLSKDSVLLRVGGAIPTAADRQVVHLILQSGGEVYYSATLNLKKGLTSVQVPVADLPSGIAQFTLFSATGYPMNERVIFIDNDDKIQLNVKSDKNVYSRREKIAIDIDAKRGNGSPAIANFSVSVINEDDVPFDDDKATTIYSHLLLSSDIKGYIEKPNYYFNNSNPGVKQQLDLLMLTQGYRRFNWADLVADKPVKIPFRAEGFATSISGRLFGLWGRKLPYGKIYIQNSKLGLFVDTVTDKNGNFNFDRLVITDSLQFTVAGRRKNNAATVRLFVDQYPKQKVNYNTNIGDLATDFRKVVKSDLVPLTKEEEARMLQRIPKNTLLKEVKVNRRAGPVNLQTIKGQISQSIIFDESDAGKTIVKALVDRNIDGFKMVKFDYYSFFLNNVGMQVYINDNKFKADETTDVLNWDVENVVKVDIVRNNNIVAPTLLIYTNTVYKPFVFFTSPVADLVWDITNVTPKGFNHVKDFYAPKYLNTNLAAQAADLRTTVYWNPSVITRDGRANFSFYNNDKPGNYKVTVEGIDAEGELGRQVYRYKIENAL